MAENDDKPIVLAACGASGQIYARWLLKLLLEHGRRVHLIVSREANAICADELGIPELTYELPDQTLEVHENDSMQSPLASGSYSTAGMIVCPCTLNTLAAISAGISDNLVKRAAQVHLKQRRPLVLAVREMPLSLIDLENMVRLARAGAYVSPLAPSFYHHPKTIDELTRYTAERLIALVADHELSFRYGGNREC
jgi:4-hydroxy-3-polyprenylbenzoate decarboxylase